MTKNFTALTRQYIDQYAEQELHNFQNRYAPVPVSVQPAADQRLRYH